MEEYVPINTPHIIAIIKPLITFPPRTINAINAIKVVNDVIIVLERVSLMDLLSSLLKSKLFTLVIFSLILSKTTTVSLIEYPAIVKIAAIEARLNSI